MPPIPNSPSHTPRRAKTRLQCLPYRVSEPVNIHTDAEELTVPSWHSSQDHYYRPYKPRTRPACETKIQAQLSTIVTQTIHGRIAPVFDGTTQWQVSSEGSGISRLSSDRFCSRNVTEYPGRTRAAVNNISREPGSAQRLSALVSDRPPVLRVVSVRSELRRPDCRANQFPSRCSGCNSNETIPYATIETNAKPSISPSSKTPAVDSSYEQWIKVPTGRYTKVRTFGQPRPNLTTTFTISIHSTTGSCLERATTVPE